MRDRLVTGAALINCLLPTVMKLMRGCNILDKHDTNRVGAWFSEYAAPGGPIVNVTCHDMSGVITPVN
jgi:hypothetical protein